MSDARVTLPTAEQFQREARIQQGPGASPSRLGEGTRVFQTRRQTLDWSGGDELTSRPGKWFFSPTSSRVRKYRWDGGNLAIHVVFKDGTPWVYRNVPYSVFRGFHRAKSKGKYINSRLNGFEYGRGNEAWR